MPEFFETHDLRRFLPLPYEAAAEPRLKRIQDKLWDSPRPAWLCLPGEGPALLRLHTLSENIRAQGQTLLAVTDGALRAGAEGVIHCLGAPGDHVLFFTGLPSEDELRRGLETAAYQDAVLYTAGGEGTPAFRLLRSALKDRYGGEAGRRILMAGELGPGEDGGFGLLSAAGLLPMAAAGVDLGSLLCGAMRMMERCKDASFKNAAWRYAAVRRQLCRSGFSVELLCCWDPSLRSLLEWAQRLFAAAEGKERKALLPVAVDYSRELRSLGQYVQGGPRLFFETVVRLDSAGKLSSIREAAAEGTLLVHTESGVPNLILRPGEKTAEALGGLIFFLQYACVLSARLMDVDPYACPGTEDCEARIRSLLRPPQDEPAELGAVLPRRPAGAGIL